MAINVTLSPRVGADGRSEVMLRYTARGVNARAGSGIYITPRNFRDGRIVPNRRALGNDVRYHEEQERRLAALLAHIEERGRETTTRDSAWLKETVAEWHGRRERDTPALVAEYMAHGEQTGRFTAQTRTTYRCALTALLRFDEWRRLTARPLPAVTRWAAREVEAFVSYLKEEHALAEADPPLFARIDNATGCNARSHAVQRGRNIVANRFTQVRAFFSWLRKRGLMAHSPFDGAEAPKESYAAAPVYITIAERNRLASFPMPTAHLTTQRDIFIFQCLTGCRVGDLARLMPGNVSADVLCYTPSKTRGETGATCRVPLLPQAVELIEKYKGRDTRGRLLPCISQQRYNDAIKECFRIAGLTREVEVQDALTGNMVLRPINELASSHMARRTFVGNAYLSVQDPALIGAMSGHVAGSKAFARYRKIEDATLRAVTEHLK